MSGDVVTGVWREFVREYTLRCRNWYLLAKIYDTRDLLRNKEILDTTYGLWGFIWHEQDLIVVFSHKLLEYIEENMLPLHLHVNYIVKPRNFKYAEKLYNNIVSSLNELRRVLKLGWRWYPRIDLIVSSDELVFEYCFEFKYYHYFPRDIDIVSDLEKKYTILRVLKKHGVCKKIVIAVLDDIICRSNKELCNKIDNFLTSLEDALVLKYYVDYNDLYRVLTKYFIE